MRQPRPRLAEQELSNAECRMRSAERRAEAGAAAGSELARTDVRGYGGGGGFSGSGLAAAQAV